MHTNTEHSLGSESDYLIFHLYLCHRKFIEIESSSEGDLYLYKLQCFCPFEYSGLGIKLPLLASSSKVIVPGALSRCLEDACSTSPVVGLLKNMLLETL